MKKKEVGDSNKSEANTNQKISVESTRIENPNQVDSSINSVFIDNNTPTGYWSGKKGKIWLLIYLLLAISAIILGVFMYVGSTNKKLSNTPELEKKVIMPTKILKVNPEITESDSKENIKATQYSLKILNGSGKEGEAAKLKSNLESFGYNVVSIGNAQRNNYTKTIISIKKSVDTRFFDLLKSKLSESYAIEDKLLLPAEEKVDVVIVIGSE